MTTLSILVYNCYLLPYPIDSGQKIRAGLMADRLGDHDVLVLCELFDLGLREQVLEGLRPRYPHVTEVLGHEGRMFNNGGVALVSRWPLQAEERRFFGESRCTGLDCFAEKGVVCATVDKDGLRCHVYGTHTQAGDRPAADRMRQAQFSLIRQMIAERAAPADEPVIVAGDLNVDSLDRAGEYRQMLEILETDTSLPPGIAGSYDPKRNPLAGGDKVELLDHVLWSRSHRAPQQAMVKIQEVRTDAPWRDGIRDLSDHHAVEATLRF